MELREKQNLREQARHYIPATDSEIGHMLEKLGLNKLDQLFAHIPEQQRFVEAPALPEEQSYEETEQLLQRIAAKNRRTISFIGDGLPDFSLHPIVEHVLSIRNLTTSYTPYQPERSQGTLYCHWVYQCAMTELTGYEAVNSSLYDRSTALYEAMAMAQRLSRNADTILLPDALYPADIEVVETIARHTPLKIRRIPLDPHTGRIDLQNLRNVAEELGEQLAGIVAPQVNCLGLLEDVDAIAEVADQASTLFIAVIDPLLLAPGGLKKPTQFGKNGADMIVGEGQHLATGPSFGGPGLGVFAARYNEQQKNMIRQTPGRYVGKARDSHGRDCRVMVMSTREQHIRKDKATSNICSNQAFIATLAGASLLARGSEGLREMLEKARKNALSATEALTTIQGIQLAFPDAALFNEVTLAVDFDISQLLEHCRKAGLHAGVDVSDRIAGDRRLLKLSFSDRQSEAEIGRLVEVLQDYAQHRGQEPQVAAEIPSDLLCKEEPAIPQIPLQELKSFYEKLGALNATPDAAPYPLGSCTMKYNPELNERSASLPGFADIHPQAPIDDIQGALEILYQIQEWFKKITGLPGVTTQPVAGAQGELVGLKLFQAYHESRGEQRDVILLPRSAHGTNFATASMAGYLPGKDGAGIVLLEANDEGQIDIAALDGAISRFGARIAGIMITNPNTSGIFETQFKQIADKIHAVGGLVYMDGANMNAIAGWVNLGALGVDAVHNNLHKTWTIPHGGGGPGDAFVAVSDKLLEFLPGWQIQKEGDRYTPVRAPKSIGSFHRHWGNFAHKVRAYAYLVRLGREGVRRMSATAVLSSRYIFERVKGEFLPLPRHSSQPRMHEFIVTLKDEDFVNIEHAGASRASIVTGLGKLFLDYGYHAPTMSWPEAHGMMIEPTESFTKAELDRFADAVIAIRHMAVEHPKALARAPFFMPVTRLDEVAANRSPTLYERLTELPDVPAAPLDQQDLQALPVDEISERLRNALRTD